MISIPSYITFHDQPVFFGLQHYLFLIISIQHKIFSGIIIYNLGIYKVITYQQYCISLLNSFKIRCLQLFIFLIAEETYILILPNQSYFYKTLLFLYNAVLN